MVVDLNSNLLPKFSRTYSCNTITHRKCLKTDFDMAVAFFHCKIFQEPEKRADSDGSKGIFLDQNEFRIFLIKMAIILPTGQWYAPSAVINDAWYCMVLHSIAWYCMVLHGIAWY